MTKVVLLECLREFTEASTRDIILPVRQQKEDKSPPDPRAAKVYLMRLEKSTAAQKVAPYILHQITTGKDVKPAGEPESARAFVRSIFSLYNENEQEGGLMLLGLMERLRIDLLKQVVIGKQFQLDREVGIEMLIYPDDTAPYYVGEMVSTWILPGIEREVRLYG